MTTYAELEIGLHRAHAGAFQVELRYTEPDNQNEITPKRGEAHIDSAALLEWLEDPQAYGELLAAQVFGDAAIRTEYLRVRTAVEVGDKRLRVKLGSIAAPSPAANKEVDDEWLA